MLKNSQKNLQKILQKSKKIRKGDKVIVISGDDRGQSGSVLSCSGNSAVVQGLNMCKKHVKRSESNPQGGVLSFEKPINISNLAIFVAEDKPVKLKVGVAADGDRELYYLDGDKKITYRSIKKQNT
jgi:large subunit ribosomal protein L24